MPDKADKLEIPIYFTPREIRKYHETVKLDFNGLYFIDINIVGEGIPLMIDLKDPDQGFIDLGVIGVGGDITKTIPLINRSVKPVKFKVCPKDSDAFLKSNMSITPSSKEEVVLKHKEVLPIEITFKPRTRLPNFSHDIMLDIENLEVKD